MGKVRLIIFAVLISLLGTACGPRTNTALSRNYQAFITRYNIYYNGDEHYRTTMTDLENSYQDDYNRIIPVHPTDIRGNTSFPQPQGGFTRSIEKAQKAIQLRSIKKRPTRRPGKSLTAEQKEWLRREEYNPFMHNAWMMMGRAQYANGDYLGAASTFYYISKHFSWLPATVTEARLWQARAYNAMGWNFEAENIVTKMPESSLTSGDLRGLYNMVYASCLLSDHEYEKAIPHVREAIKYSSGAQKSRLWFLLGQLYAATGHKNEAYEAYGKAGGGASSYRGQVNARIAQSEVYSGSDITKEINSLKRMTRYDRNKDYLDQLYYAIGNLYLSRRDTVRAIENYRLAAERSTRKGVERAISQLTLGNLYYERRQYDKAQPCYAEALPVLPDTYPGYDTLKLRSDVLDELALYTENVNLNDSLLRLAAMPEAERIKVIERHIADLKKKEAEEAERVKREEYLASQQAKGNALKNNSGNAGAPREFMLNTDDSWYFYNTATVNAGKTEFQRRWGSRRLEDDWRRHDKTSFSFDDFEKHDEEGEGESDDMQSPSDTVPDQSSKTLDQYDPEYYLRQLPMTPEAVASCNDIIVDGMYNIGLILKDRLEAFDDAADEWNQLLRRYPDNIYRLDIYYNLYLMYTRLGNKSMAEHYRALMLSDFPESKYGQAVSDPNYIENLKRMSGEQEELYEKAYQDYLDGNNSDVHTAYTDMSERYPMSELMPKFMFIDALAYVTDKDADGFKTRLRELLERYPDTEVTPLASSYLKGLAQGRELEAGEGGNPRGMLWDLRLGNDSTDVIGEEVTFDLDENAPQLLVLVYDTDEISGNQLLYDVARHNFNSFVVRDFDLEQMNFGRLGLLVVKGFANFDELTHYRSVMGASTTFSLPEGVKPVMISESDFDKLLHGGLTFDDYFRYVDGEAADRPVVAGPGLNDDN